MLRIIDPRLVSEFRQLVGHEQISICSLAALVQGISKTDPSRVSQLAAAIQIDFSTEKIALPADNSLPESGVVGAGTIVEGADRAAAEGSVEAEGTGRQTSPVQPPAGGAELVFDLDGYRDGQYETDAPGDLNGIVGALRSHNWYTQNPAIERIKTIRDKNFSPTAWFVLGRNIYQAACGNAQKAMDFMANLDIQLKRFPGEVAQYLLAGIVYEIYFDSRGELRGSPKAGYFGKPLGVIASTDYVQVRTFIRAKLREAGAQLRFLPGDDRKFAVVIESQSIDESGAAAGADKKRRLTSVRFEEIELLVEVGQHPDEEWGIITQTYSADGIVEEISTSLCIPKWAITRQFNPIIRSDSRLTVPEGRWLRAQNAALHLGA